MTKIFTVQCIKNGGYSCLLAMSHRTKQVSKKNFITDVRFISSELKTTPPPSPCYACGTLALPWMAHHKVGFCGVC